ncbi:hypothetical protein SEPL_293 [Salmonella phage SE_PL]|nr:hypothetical protein CPT_Munch_132 [Salmonella phage Munch]QCW18811.1 hypothetical protein 7t3_0290 [Salmonella phage 7t3]QIG62906.1 hypothetical protein SEPL_293 [Salmonella phage SE_PL]WNV47239.1 hypothetical protein [Klebsiella phage fENko-Kae01]
MYLLFSVLVMIGISFATYIIMKIINYSVNVDMNGNSRNFKVRYNPSNHKYYLTNASRFGDIDVCRFGPFFRVYYKSKIDADLVMQKLNDYQ